MFIEDSVFWDNVIVILDIREVRVRNPPGVLTVRLMYIYFQCN
jgi:hypothetical protein